MLTAADIPGELRMGLIHKDWPVMIPVGGTTSYAGDVLAVVVAATRQQARAAAALVEVTYDVQRPITDPVAAIDDPEIAVWGTDSQRAVARRRTQRGDVEAALAASAHVVRETFETQRIEHAFLEPEATLAVPDAAAGTMHVYSGGQGVWDDRDDICRMLGVEPRPGHRRAGVERRRLRRQGGHGQPGPRRAGRLAPAAAGEVRAVPRGELPDARQAAPDPHGLRGRAATPTAG